MAKNRGSAQRREETTETQTITQADVATIESTEVSGELKFANPYKYEGKQKSALDAKVDYLPTWAKRNTKFHPATKPKLDKSVMAVIHKIVSEEPGIVGSDLAVRIRYYNFPNRKRSKYLDGGLPAVGWAEGYVDGAVTKGFLRMEKEEVAKSVAEDSTASEEQTETE